jgi:hypothetical protein
MRELHLLRFFANHHQQHDSQKNAGANQHLSIWETLLKNEREYSDYPGKEKAEQRTLQDDASA